MINKKQIKPALKSCSSFMVGLLVLVVLTVVGGNKILVFADARCGVGYECWEGNGGTASVYTECQAYGNGLSGYCGGSGGEKYCDCTGSSDCTCSLGPGTDCSYGTPYENSDYSCKCSGNPFRSCAIDEECALYGDGVCSDCSGGDRYLCPPPIGYSTIGCCYGDGSDPGVCGNGICDSDENCSTCPSECGECPPSCDTVTADVKADGSDSDITTSAPYIISWTSVNANACSINTDSVFLNGSDTYPGDTPGDYTYSLSCQNNCGNSDTDTITIPEMARIPE